MNHPPKRKRMGCRSTLLCSSQSSCENRLVWEALPKNGIFASETRRKIFTVKNDCQCIKSEQKRHLCKKIKIIQWFITRLFKLKMGGNGTPPLKKTKQTNPYFICTEPFVYKVEIKIHNFEHKFHKSEILIQYVLQYQHTRLLCAKKNK